MTEKETKVILMQYPEMASQISKMEAEMKTIGEAVDSIRHMQEMGLGAARSKESSETCRKMQDMLWEYESRFKVLLERIEKIYKRQNVLTDGLAVLTADEQAIIKKRYFEKLKWDFIPLKVHISRRQCFRIHDCAMEKLMRMIGEG